MKDHGRFNVGALAYSDHMFPCGMSPALILSVFSSGIHPVLDHNICILDKLLDSIIIGCAPHFVIRDDAHGLSIELHPITASAARMVQRNGFDYQPIVFLQRVSSLETFKGNCAKRVRSNWKYWGGHYAADNFLETAWVFEMTSHSGDSEIGIVGGFKEGKAADMVQMRVREEKVDIPIGTFHNLTSKITGAGTTVDHNKSIPCPYFEAGGFPSISECFGTSSSR